MYCFVECLQVVGDSPITVGDSGRWSLESPASELARGTGTAKETADCTGTGCVAVEGRLEQTEVEIEAAGGGHIGFAEILEGDRLVARQVA